MSDTNTRAGGDCYHNTILSYTCRYRKNPKLAIQKQENLTVVFKFIKEDEKIELVNIGQYNDLCLCSEDVIVQLV